MLRFFVVISFAFFAGTDLCAQVKPVNPEQIEMLQAKDKKLVMVVIQTSWCKFCHALRQNIERNKLVSATLAKSFYTVFLNAEVRTDIVFAGKRFKYQPNGIHELAEQLGTINGQITYPSICFLNEKNEIIYQYEGYLKPASLVQLLNRLSQNK